MNDYTTVLLSNPSTQTAAEEIQPVSEQEKQHLEDCEGKIVKIAPSMIHANKSQPRTVFNDNAIIRLADSIKRYGILQPLTVRLDPAENGTLSYELVAGERRLRASQLLGLETVPCIIMKVDDKKSAELAIIENLLRENLNIFEQAEAFQKLIDTFSLTQEEVAKRISLSQSAVANKLRLLRLPAAVQHLLVENNLTERHARALLRLPDETAMLGALERIVAHKMNVGQSETYIDTLIKSPKKERTNDSSATGSAADQSSTIEPYFDWKSRDDKISAFFGTINRAVGTLNLSAIDAQVVREDGQGEVRFFIRIPR